MESKLQEANGKQR